MGDLIKSAKRAISNVLGGSNGSQVAETRATLYEEAKRRDIPGRSRMSKDELRRALGR